MTEEAKGDERAETKRQIAAVEAKIERVEAALEAHGLPLDSPERPIVLILKPSKL